MTVMGDALMEGLSDAGSIPARSTKKAESFKLSAFSFYNPFTNSSAYFDATAPSATAVTI